MKSISMKVIICLLVITSCTPVQFYSDAGCTKSTGLKYYTVKPYLQVEREAVSNNINKITVLYLPDIEKPQYLAVKDGWGSGKADLKLAEGMINTFSLTADSEIDESLEAFATLISKGTASIEDLSKLKGITPGAAPAVISELYEVIMTNGLITLRKIDIK